MKMSIRQIIANALMAIVSCIFLYAGAVKVINPVDFQISIESFGIVSGFWAQVSAYFLPCFEITVGWALLFSRYRNTAAILTAGMLALFIFAAVYSWIFGLDISCGCFGGIEPTSQPNILLRNAIILSIIFLAKKLF